MVSLASLLENKVMASSVALFKFLKQTILPCDFFSPNILLVLEKACIKPCCFKFLSTYKVFTFLASKPVNIIFTTITMSKRSLASLKFFFSLSFNLLLMSLK